VLRHVTRASLCYPGFVYLAEELPRLFPDKKPDHIGLFDNILTQNPRTTPQEKSKTQSRKIESWGCKIQNRPSRYPFCGLDPDRSRNEFKNLEKFCGR
jgi:hypothetical protein